MEMNYSGRRFFLLEVYFIIIFINNIKWSNNILGENNMTENKIYKHL